MCRLHHFGFRPCRTGPSSSARAGCATSSSRRKNAPCVIFIDEIDAVGRHRGARSWRRQRRARADAQPVAGRDRRLRAERRHHHHRRHQSARRARCGAVDGPAGFDRQIVISNPDFIGREKILRVHVRKVPLGPDVDLKVVSRGTPGFSGADLMNSGLTRRRCWRRGAESASSRVRNSRIRATRS